MTLLDNFKFLAAQRDGSGSGNIIWVFMFLLKKSGFIFETHTVTW